jgi:farnesyl-diphosphate farnesyltransferase
MNKPVTPSANLDDEAYQDHILQGVSRTFALTIPQLPDPLYRVVSNAYLLCRIADTIEDDKSMNADLKRQFAERFIRVVAGNDSAENFAKELSPHLSIEATDHEHDLIANTAAIIRITHSFNSRQRAALERCIAIMAEGMARYQDAETLDGLADLPDMGQYCYYVAGVVGEMLTEIFCDYSAEIDQQRESLMQLAVSFGQGLQMTNILKDIWEDHYRGACWLPRDIFLKYSVDIRNKNPGQMDQGFEQGLGELIGVARTHLANALRYTLLIPGHEKGIRRFCLWACRGQDIQTKCQNRDPDHQPLCQQGQDAKSFI